MPNIKSQEKRVLVSAKERESNNSKRSRIKTAIKKFNLAVEQKDITLADSLFKDLISLLDKSYYDGIYHKNTVARKKSSVSKLYNSLKA